MSSGSQHPFTDLLLNSKASRKVARDAAVKLQQRAPLPPPPPSCQRAKKEVATDRRETQDEGEEAPQHHQPPSVLPLRRLFADHLEEVARSPVILYNMPTYYAVVADLLQAALGDTELHLRTQAMSSPPPDLEPLGVSSLGPVQSRTAGSDNQK